MKGRNLYTLSSWDYYCNCGDDSDVFELLADSEVSCTNLRGFDAVARVDIYDRLLLCVEVHPWPDRSWTDYEISFSTLDSALMHDEVEVLIIYMSGYDLETVVEEADSRALQQGWQLL